MSQSPTVLISEWGSSENSGIPIRLPALCKCYRTLSNCSGEDRPQGARPVGECDGELATTPAPATLSPPPLSAAEGKGRVWRFLLALHRIHHAGKLPGVLCHLIVARPSWPCFATGWKPVPRNPRCLGSSASRAAVGQGHRTGSSGENCKMLRENGTDFWPRREPVGSHPPASATSGRSASAAKRRKSSGKTAILSRVVARQPQRAAGNVRAATPQVRPPVGGTTAEIVEKNERRGENPRANLLDRFLIAQVARCESRRLLTSAGWLGSNKVNPQRPKAGGSLRSTPATQLEVRQKASLHGRARRCRSRGGGVYSL